MIQSENLCTIFHSKILEKEAKFTVEYKNLRFTFSNSEEKQTMTEWAVFP